MSVADYRSILYSKNMSPLEFKFETLTAPSMYNWLSPYDISSLYNIATSVKYDSKITKKKNAINEIMTERGCRKIGGGTNRVVYAPYECKNMCIKIALDSIGMHDNPAEYSNQFLLKPYVTKMFEHDPSGCVGAVERVKPVQSREEYLSIADDIFELLSKNIIGKYVLEDIGTKYMFNYGVRVGFGVVLLDYPLVFELDGSKLHCNELLPDGTFCGGEIDYDSGFNHLYCCKCGKHYQARKLGLQIKNKQISITKEETDMSLVSQLIINGKVVRESDGSTDTVQINEPCGVLKEKRKPFMKGENNKKPFNKNNNRYNKKEESKEEEDHSTYIREKDQPVTIGEVLKDKQEEKEELKQSIDASQLQQQMLSQKEEPEIDYSSFGLENPEEENEQSVEEDNQKDEEEYEHLVKDKQRFDKKNSVQSKKVNSKLAGL